MSEILVEYKDQILAVASFIYIPFLAFIISLGVVYLFGRMLDIVKKDRHRNGLAILSMLGTYAFYFKRINSDGDLVHKAWFTIIYTAISIILYVLIGFKLYDRFGGLLDKVAPDHKHTKHK